MSESGRKIVNFRLTEEGRRLLRELADRRGISQAAMVELMVREQARLDGSYELKSAA